MSEGKENGLNEDDSAFRTTERSKKNASNEEFDNIAKTQNRQESEDIMFNSLINSAAIFQSQQIGDPELTTNDKKRIAKDLFYKNPVSFLERFGKFLKEDDLNYLMQLHNSSYEVEFYVKSLKASLSNKKRKLIAKNRRYEAMKQLEAEGSYFSEVEMEKREPLLYHQMVGQFLSEKEKIIKNRQVQGDVIPTFSNFLISKMERDELNELFKSQQKEENIETEISSEEEISENVDRNQKRWGDDWEDEERNKKKTKHKKARNQKNVICAKEKALLLEEFRSIMKNKFLIGNDNDFNYSEVDFNPEYDSIEIRTRDEEEKYFDEETLDTSVCTDTGVEDY